MAVRQISAFLQSKPGHLARILQVFENAQVSVKGYSISDTGDYGIGRFIVDDPDTAINALEEEGVAHAETDVICVYLEDTPGELARVMKLIADIGINVSYSYSLISTYIAIKTDDVDGATAALASSSLTMANQADLSGSATTQGM